MISLGAQRMMWDRARAIIDATAFRRQKDEEISQEFQLRHLSDLENEASLTEEIIRHQLDPITEENRESRTIFQKFHDEVKNLSPNSDPNFWQSIMNIINEQ
jgi:hypothetical protein